MKLTNINRAIVNFFGKEIQHQDETGVMKPLTYKDAMILSLLNSGKPSDTDEEKYKKFELAKKIAASDNVLELESPEQSLIRACSAIAWNVLVHGFVRDFVEGKNA